MKLAAQNRELQNREMSIPQTMSHPDGHMTSRSIHPGGIPAGEKSGLFK